jgi:hypothetical protein
VKQALVWWLSDVGGRAVVFGTERAAEALELTLSLTLISFSLLHGHRTAPL